MTCCDVYTTDAADTASIFGRFLEVSAGPQTGKDNCAPDMMQICNLTNPIYQTPVDYENDEADKSENDLINKLSQSYAEPAKAADAIRKLFETKTAKVCQTTASLTIRACLDKMCLHKDAHDLFHDILADDVMFLLSSCFWLMYTCLLMA
jgi:hypothetical protein